MEDRKRPDRDHIRMDWIEYVIQNPVKEEVQREMNNENTIFSGY